MVYISHKQNETKNTQCLHKFNSMLSLQLFPIKKGPVAYSIFGLMSQFPTFMTVFKYR